MALTNAGKAEIMANGFTANTKYISLHLTNNTELSGHGYARKAWTSGDMTVNATNGRVTATANFEIYTANDNSAQKAIKVAIYNHATNSAAANQILTPENLTGTAPEAPILNQTFRLSSLVIIP